MDTITEITQLTRKNVNEIERKVNERLAELSEEIGVNLTVSGGTFSKVEATLKLKIQVQNPDTGSFYTKEGEDFKHNAHLVGMKPSDLGKTFKKYGQEVYTIEGLRIRARKSPILCKKISNGKMYGFAADAVKFHLTAEKD
jgi:hypothetical protein